MRRDRGALPQPRPGAAGAERARGKLAVPALPHGRRPARDRRRPRPHRHGDAARRRGPRAACRRDRLQAIVLAAPGIDAHRLPAPLAPLVRELAETRWVFELPERLCVNWDGSTVLFEVGLEQVFEQGDSGDGVIFEADERYVQVLVNRERKVVYGEAVDPAHWQAGPPLTPEQRRRLAELGWSEPGRPFQSPNYARLWTLGPHCTIEDIAWVLATTMADVYRPTPGTRLESTIIYYGGRETGPEPRFLDAVEVDARYRDLLRGGESLEGPVLRPERRYRYEDVNDLAELAAALLVAVNRRHALVDGNKRASITLTDEFLALNGYRLEGDDQQLRRARLGGRSRARRNRDARTAAPVRCRRRPRRAVPGSLPGRDRGAGAVSAAHPQSTFSRPRSAVREPVVA